MLNFSQTSIVCWRINKKKLDPRLKYGNCSHTLCMQSISAFQHLLCCWKEVCSSNSCLEITFSQSKEALSRGRELNTERCIQVYFKVTGYLCKALHGIQTIAHFRSSFRKELYSKHLGNVWRWQIKVVTDIGSPIDPPSIVSCSFEAWCELQKELTEPDEQKAGRHMKLIFDKWKTAHTGRALCIHCCFLSSLTFSTAPPSALFQVINHFEVSSTYWLLVYVE